MIREEVFRNYLWSAGMVGFGGSDVNGGGVGPPGLGSPEDQEEQENEKQDAEEQQKTSIGLRYIDRHERSRRPSGNGRGR